MGKAAGRGRALGGAEVLLAALRKMHSPDRGWQFVEELRIGTGYGPTSEQRIDAWAIQAWGVGSGFKDAKVANLRRAFEVKVCPKDLRAELLNPDKRWFARAMSHEFFFVVPAGLCDPVLLAEGEGLIEWDGEKLEVVKAARRFEAMPPRWEFVASLVRTLRGREAVDRLRERHQEVDAIGAESDGSGGSD